ncbi:hypothetical protein B0H16DRAFT_1815226 [Mycena metata]|uniref:Uncharacterized protein n=1 Tax=Mycena metata TaxID=1033252 RepID=A0AAD7JBX8_9AGAR|nr:hypothetical protein B0H16DRAFT_1815226 [Mycena metata]
MHAEILTAKPLSKGGRSPYPPRRFFSPTTFEHPHQLDVASLLAFYVLPLSIPLSSLLPAHAPESARKRGRASSIYCKTSTGLPLNLATVPFTPLTRSSLALTESHPPLVHLHLLHPFVGEVLLSIVGGLLLGYTLPASASSPSSPPSSLCASTSSGRTPSSRTEVPPPAHGPPRRVQAPAGALVPAAAKHATLLVPLVVAQLVHLQDIIPLRTDGCALLLLALRVLAVPATAAVLALFLLLPAAPARVRIETALLPADILPSVPSTAPPPHSTLPPCCARSTAPRACTCSSLRMHNVGTLPSYLVPAPPNSLRTPLPALSCARVLCTKTVRACTNASCMRSCGQIAQTRIESPAPHLHCHPLRRTLQIGAVPSLRKIHFERALLCFKFFEGRGVRVRVRASARVSFLQFSIPGSRGVVLEEDLRAEGPARWCTYDLQTVCRRSADDLQMGLKPSQT